ncbi:MAG: Jag N-terminal domain-containing protein [Desulfobacterales bacterium]|nr:MAG: Jag N-terminal domain-containing protein [Desulfobacterales bacterium]
MMSSLEFEGKNVEKALDKESKQLNIAKDQLEYDILSYGSSGIFGLAGTKKARIRVNLAEASPEAVSETSTFDEEIEMPAETHDDFAPAEKDYRDDHSVDQKLFTFPKDPLDLGRSVLQRIIDSITSDASITVEEDSDRIFFNVVGGNAGVLIGKRGQTLEAIQSLVEKVVNKHNDNDNRIRVRVDIEGYMKTRRVNLERLAARLAEKSKRIGKPISLGQMSSHDRRIIHLALEDDPDVRTKSRGEGYLRKLVIFPKKKNE